MEKFFLPPPLSLAWRVTLSTKTTAIILAAVLVVAATGIGIYFYTSPENNENGEINKSDPLIGNIGIGSTFTYNSTLMGTITATVVGQSGSHYLLQLSDDEFLMFHKQTGQLRFSESTGTDTIIYGGETISLNKWEWVMMDLSTEDTSGGETVTVRNIISYTLSSSPEDAVPYKIGVTVEVHIGELIITVALDSLVLTDMNILKTEEYVSSDDIDKGYVFSFENMQLEGMYFDGEGDLICIAEDGDLKFSLGWIRLGNEGFVMSFMEGTINDNMIPPGAVQMLDETISTIDGNVLCEVYKSEEYYGTEVAEVFTYIGKDSRVLYYEKTLYADGEVGERILKGRIP